MKKKYRIYGLKIINIEEIKYIGYTKRTINERFSGHKQECKVRKTYKDNWLRKNINNVEIILIEDDIKTYEEALKREIYWINYYKNILKCKLTNSTDGGDGTVGRILTEEQKKNISLKNLGKKLSKEHKEKIGKAHKNKILTVEHKEKLKKAKENVTVDTRIKMRFKKYKKWLLKHDYNLDNMSQEDIILLRENIKNKEILLKNEHIKEKLFNSLTNEEKVLFNNDIKNLLLNDLVLKIKEYRNKEKERIKLENREKSRLKRIEAQKRKEDQIKERDRKLESGELYKIVKDNGKIHYVPVMTDEQKQKNGEYNRTHKRSEETTKKIIESGKKTREAKGKEYYKLSEEKKENLRQKNLGKKYSEETKRKHSLNSRGNGNGCAKITEQDVRDIRRLSLEGKTRTEISKMYNMDYTTICKIILRTLWKHVE